MFRQMKFGQAIRQSLLKPIQLKWKNYWAGKVSVSNFDFYMMHLFKISEQRKQSSLFETINLFLLLSLSGINFFSDNETILIVVFVLNLFAFLLKNEKIDNGFLGFTLFFIFCQLPSWFGCLTGVWKVRLVFFSGCSPPTLHLEILLILSRLISVCCFS